MRAHRALVMVAGLGLGLVACAGSPGSDGQPAQGGASAATTSTTISVAAAASLQRSFEEIIEAFEAQHPEVDVAPVNYDGSSTLAMQVLEGAPFDVFAAADARNMQVVVDAGLAGGDAGMAGGPAVFATNTLVIAVPQGNPANVTGLGDLADVTTVLCAPEVPCGGASETLLANAGVSVKPASLEQNVTAVMQKVAAGEADAGLVYRTDVAGDSSVQGIEPAGAADVVNVYPIAAVGGNDRPDDRQAAAQAFIDFVLSDEGQTVLAAHGFGAAA